jgi:hypothetical protein
MNSIIAFDSHKHYTFARVENENGENPQEFRIEHRRGSIAGFLSSQQPGSGLSSRTVSTRFLTNTACRMRSRISAISSAEKV